MVSCHIITQMNSCLPMQQPVHNTSIVTHDTECHECLLMYSLYCDVAMRVGQKHRMQSTEILLLLFATVHTSSRYRRVQSQ